MCSRREPTSWPRSKAGSAGSTARRRRTGDVGPPTLVANAGDRGVAELLPRLVDWPGRLLAFEVIVGDAAAAERRIAELGAVYRTSIGPAAGLVARYEADPDGTARIVVHGIHGHEAEIAHLRLIGRHNADDALGAAGGALAYGAAAEAVLNGLRTFAGVGRRFERQGRGRRGRRPRRLRASPDGHRGDARRRRPALPGPPDLGGLRTADLPPDRGDARAVRRRACPGGPRRDRRHLRRPGT